MLKEFDMPFRFAEKINHSEFSERLYFCLKEDGNDINYGDFHSKFLKNGLIKIIKSLGLYKVKGSRENKKVYIHPKLEIIISSSCYDNKVISKTIMDLFDGKYANIPSFENLNLYEFNQLPNNDVFNKSHGYGTYIALNERTGLFKIGKTRNVERRIVKLKQEFGDNINLISFFSEDVEYELHEKLKYNRVYGEWFDITLDCALDISNEYGFEFKSK